MARLRYDYAIAYDAAVQFDQVNGPEVPYTSTDLGMPADSLAELSISDTLARLGITENTHLDVEGRP